MYSYPRKQRWAGISLVITLSILMIASLCASQEIDWKKGVAWNVNGRIYDIQRDQDHKYFLIVKKHKAVDRALKSIFVFIDDDTMIGDPKHRLAPNKLKIGWGVTVEGIKVVVYDGDQKIIAVRAKQIYPGE